MLKCFINQNYITIYLYELLKNKMFKEKCIYIYIYIYIHMHAFIYEDHSINKVNFTTGIGNCKHCL